MGLEAFSGFTKNISFTPDVLGRYEIKLSVANEDIVSDAEQVIVYAQGPYQFTNKSLLDTFTQSNYRNGSELPVLGDVDGNGKLDIIVYAANNNNQDHGRYLNIFKQNLDNEFYQTATYFHNFSESSELIDALDFTGDGIEEIILKRKTVFEVNKLNADGTLKLLGKVDIGRTDDYDLGTHTRPIFADVNGDGKQDIVWKDRSPSNTFRQSIFVSLQSSSQSDILGSRLEYQLPYEVNPYQTDGFSKLGIFKSLNDSNDFITVLHHIGPNSDDENESLNLLKIKYQDSTGSLVLGENKILSHEFIELEDHFGVFRVLAEDINNDGLIDIIGKDDEPQIYFSVETPNISKILLLDKYAHKEGLIRLIDINNDGLKDVVMTDHIFFQDHNLSFDKVDQLNTQYSYDGAIYDDFNNDGLLDAIHLDGYDTLSIRYFLQSN